MRLLWLPVMIMTLLSCTPSKIELNSTAVQKDSLAIHPGEVLFNAYCNSCHNDVAMEGARLAPPMLAIKQRYQNAHPDSASFTKAIVDFVLHPAQEKALMSNAVRKFNLMLPMAYPEDDLVQIADYIAKQAFKHPSDRLQDGPVPLESMTAYEKGQYFASSTKAVLGKQLMGKLHGDGTLAALEFCNLQAMHFTDSMSLKHNAAIKRVTDQARNAKNKANPTEAEIIGRWKRALSAGKVIEPLLDSNADGSFNFYAPILTNAMCLRCHGNQGDIQPEVAHTLNQLYPADRATGYGAGELRGIWSIQWP
ncbi:MAG: DUF3365 domain-containing protein [Flavobacteriales bacterium]|nr:DUF3365 domain-containing protein [Flavobacteriales bacterium]